MNEKLIDMAKQAMYNSYSPYSKFKVGAALLTSSGNIYTGSNVENASYGAAICAERTAAVKAVSNGEVSFKKIAVVSSSGEYTYPCGICLQFLSEFMEKGVVILQDDKEGIKEIAFDKLFPNAFKL